MNRIIEHVLLIISAFFLITQTALGENKNMDNVTAQDTLNAVIPNKHNDFIAVGEKGTILSIQANKGWIRQKSGTTNNLNSIIKAKKGFVIVGDKGTILTGTHGGKWETRISNTNSDLYGIMYAGGKYITVGDKGTILTSSDSISWKEQKSGISAPLYSITYSPMLKKWVAVGSYSTILISDDGASWKKYDVPNSNLSTVIWSPVSKEFVAPGYRLRPLGTVATAIEGVVLSSQDGTSWHVIHESGAITQIRGITYSDRTGGIVAVGERGTIITSPDGKNWEYHKTGDNDDLYGITYANGSFVTVGQYGSVFVSTDGTEWKQTELPAKHLTKNLEQVVMLDVQGLFGGTDLWISGDGQAVVRFVRPGGKSTPGLQELCYSFKLSEEQQASLIKLIKEHNFFELTIPHRYGVPDEARPAIFIKSDKTYAVAKWEMDRHPDFDAIYFFLMDVAKSGKSGTQIKAGAYERQWKPDGFPPNKEIWDMTSPVIKEK